MAPVLEDRDIADVETWSLTGPFPSSVEAAPRTAGTAWDALLAEALAGSPKARMTEPLACVARELGLFAIAHKAQPVEDLREFVAARCGSPASHVRGARQTFEEVGAATTEEELLAAAREGLVAQVKELVAGGEPIDVGIWFGNQGGRAVVMLAIAVRYAELAPVAVVPADGAVSIRGNALVPAAHVGAFVTRGAFGAEPCSPDANVAPPSFSLTCKVDPGDASAWIDVGVTPQGRILSRSVLSVLVFPKGQPGNVYRRPSLPVPHEPTAGATLETGFVEALNTLREHAQLTRVHDAPAQSAIAKRLAPHYFAHGDDDAHNDKIALGIMAGWDVEGVVRYGRFSSASLAHTEDRGRLLASLVGHAMGRTVLLDPEIAYVAIGTVTSSGKEAVGALIGSYSLYDVQAHEIRIGNAMPRLARIRKAAGKPPAVRVRGLESLAQEAASAVESGVPPRKALQAFMKATAEMKRGAVSGLIVETESLRDFTLPADLAGAQTLEYGIAVAYYKNPGEPWGRYVLLFVFPGGMPA